MKEQTLINKEEIEGPNNSGEPRKKIQARSKQRGLCEGDTDIFDDVLSPWLEAGLFETLRETVDWRHMSHQGGHVPRLVAVQGDVAADGSIPVYRHPSDESPPLRPFTKVVDAVRAEVERFLGHTLNHALIQLYRDGDDYISEHSDKTLDVVPETYIANLSLDASSVELPVPSDLTQGSRRIERATLRHNSLCRMGPHTNMKWLHAIRPDKRAARDKTEAERAFDGERISLTFRCIGTFLSAESTCIWGQGATTKTRATARPVRNGPHSEAVAMLRAFGAENHAIDFDWNGCYGAGFDILHMNTSSRLFLCSDHLSNAAVLLCLAELGVYYARGSIGDSAGAQEMRFIDNDANRSVVQGDVAILFYLDTRHRGARGENTSSTAAHALEARYSLFQRALMLRNDILSPRKLQRALTEWDAILTAKDGFLAGPTPSLSDFIFWPVLLATRSKAGDAATVLNGLRQYDELWQGRESAKVLQ